MSEAFDTRPAGDRGLLVELEGNATVHAFARAARGHFGDRLADVVPGHTTVLLLFHAGADIPDISALANAATETPDQPIDGAGPPLATTIRVRYDGQDLMAVARRLGVEPERVIELHGAPTYTVAFMGFAPGFPYLVGLPPELELPRFQTPRVDVPAGSVAVAAGYCGIYPRRSPGGWNLLGRTDLTLFDPARNRPALLAPGDRVRFEPA